MLFGTSSLELLLTKNVRIFVGNKILKMFNNRHSVKISINILQYTFYYYCDPSSVSVKFTTRKQNK